MCEKKLKMVKSGYFDSAYMVSSQNSGSQDRIVSSYACLGLYWLGKGHGLG